MSFFDFVNMNIITQNLHYSLVKYETKQVFFSIFMFFHQHLLEFGINRKNYSYIHNNEVLFVNLFSILQAYDVF